jgi:hypothetical protein
MKKSYSLTPKQFEYIVEQCDAVLAKHKSVFSIVGIAWLNVLHSHPSIQERYVHVFYKRSIAALIGVIIKGTGIILKNIFLSFVSIFGKKGNWKKLPVETDILFVSHLLNAQTPQEAPDFYFQDLPEYLQKRGYHTAIGLMNHVKGFKGWDTGKIQPQELPEKFLLPDRLDLRAELLMIGRCLKTTLFFLKQYLKEKEPLKRSFLLELTGNSLSPHTLRAYREYEIISTILNYTNTKVVALTWEGHSWEKMICHAAKTTNRKIQCIGYQHTILYPSSHSLKRSVGCTYDPDIILTVGAVTQEILSSSPDLAKIKIQAYGSPRLHREHAGRIKKQIQNGCLVAPDGVFNECIILFTFSLEAARLMPGTDFIFRTHPAINFSDLQAQDSRLRDLPSNVIISSNKNIDDDFKRCSWLLYRVSSVSFFAVLEGLRPIYLGIPGEIVNDVLYALDNWRKHIANPQGLMQIIDNDKCAANEELYAESEEAYRFCKAYMLPYDKHIFEQCISREIANG